MFKKLKKRRLSLNFKKKSTSLRNINIVQTFVHQTAKIMSASAENLNIDNSSVSLVNLVDQSFQTNPKCSTAPTSSFSSPNCNEKAYRSKISFTSINGNVGQERGTSPIYFPSDEWNNNNNNNYESIDMIVEENSLSEKINNFIIIKNVEREPTFNSNIFDSPQRLKSSITRCYSCDDLNIKQMPSLTIRHGSIQTFISINATLSVEIDSKADQFRDELTSDELQIEKEELVESEADYLTMEIFNEKKTYFEIIRNYMSHPLFITGAVITGIIILAPAINKLPKWFATAFPKPQELQIDQLSHLEPLGPEFLLPNPQTPLYDLDDDYVFTKTDSNLYIFIPNILQEQLKRITSFISNGFRKY